MRGGKRLERGLYCRYPCIDSTLTPPAPEPFTFTNRIWERNGHVTCDFFSVISNSTNLLLVTQILNDHILKSKLI